ncbi:cathepsin C precursor, putative [Babesia bigemina]|uniref:Dipeptidyl peptidase 1 n=1 Tax=Babesia bigemina TaxID=5866 RepID=A0A061DD89_BABBI|nr:cathepsin C precursor, putative [Babesia bigemina]CDR96060.1 cathepsin C precursor, putative [Babesia bigemina]|eukprot:XP_012768246.1 cathepsin C precursor, putative [Babesia bigemina]
MLPLLCLIHLLASVVQVRADLPIHALVTDISGKWRIFQSRAVGGLDVACGSDVPNSPEGNLLLGNYLAYLKTHFCLDRTTDVHLSLDVTAYSDNTNAPNRSMWRALAVKDKRGNVVGRWTAVSDQGFEIIFHNNARYFFYLHYTKRDGDQYETDVTKTQIGWVYEPQGSSDAHATRRCAYAARVDGTKPRVSTIVQLKSNDVKNKYRQISRFISHDTGGVLSAASNKISPKKGPYPCDCSSRNQLDFDDDVPESFVWHTQATIPVVNQQQCGSCYAIATKYVLHARFLIALERCGERTPEQEKALEELSHNYFYPEDTSDCSMFNQGCKGGYPYLMGKQMHELGISVVKGNAQQCAILSAERRYFAKDYGYVSGCSQCTACQGEELIMREIYANGPVVTAVDAAILNTEYDGSVISPVDSEHNSGVCDVEQHPILTGWEYTSHAVAIVGWGQQLEQGKMVKYWLCRNSWGPEWGEDGYFKIERGKNVFGVESEAVFVDPDLSRFKQAPADARLHDIHYHY